MSIAKQGGRRSVGLNELRNRRIPGVYLINVPKCVKSYFKVGISEEDVERRLEQYLTYYPWSFYVVAVILYPDNWEKYYLCRQAESELLKFLKEAQVKNFEGQQRTEWVKLKTQKQIKQTLAKMEEIANKTGGAYTYFGSTHVIKLPE